MQIFDAVALGEPRLTRDGYLVADAKIARTGIQLYRGKEADPENRHGFRDQAVVRVLRPESEVFSTDAMASFAHRPVTNDHPAESVSATNWKDHSVGITGNEIARDGAFIRVPMVVMDKAAIDAWKAGKRELSCGYTCDLAFEPGVTADGQAYDAIQKNIRGNHLAIVGRGRAGSECRIGDMGAPENGQSQAPVHQGDRHMTLKTITVDGLPVETTDAGIAAIEKMRGLLTVADKALSDEKAAHAKTKAEADAEKAKKDVENEDLKKKVVDGAALDKLVADRAAVVTKAKALDPKVVTDGKSNAEIKRAIIGDAANGQSDDYVNAAWDMKTVDAANDSVRDAIRTQDHSMNANDAWNDGVFAAAGVAQLKKGA
ncbi:hypothetical protein ASG17_07625 [Brevundimonas sp. Leaf363]|uniref:DUF2213 domain-containing protein n=1 Tax=Brevundimonas sp. Leaf363 TaxID=1736353 RepID=UPI0006FB48FE|nr:DUF2213 domain-containing protein [Brevundimonas sp. Leaf363]KQS55911.1 hypothetical protein ASG17_07625 [Brevundimonas sp. Leaf363]